MKLNTNAGKILRLFFGRRVFDDQNAVNIIKELDAYGKELDDVGVSIEEVLVQFHPQTATWALDRWEKELKIPTDINKPIEQRRSVVLSKLRGVGMVTIFLVKIVAEAYDRGTVEVGNIPDEYAFYVRFIDTRGVPPNLNDLKSIIDEIQPAHLEAVYEFTFTLVGDLINWGTIVDDLVTAGVTVEELKTWAPA